MVLLKLILASKLCELEQFENRAANAGITGWTHRIWSLNFLLKGLNKLCSDSNICVADKSNQNNNIGV